MQDLAAKFVVYGSVVQYSWYYYRILARKAKPALATWLVFAVAASCALAAHLVDPAHNGTFIGKVLSWDNIANKVDVPLLWLAVAAVWWRGTNEKQRHFSAFDRWCLAAAGTLLALWLAAKCFFHGADAIVNILFNILMEAGYPPTFGKMAKEKKNTEPFPVWGLSFAVCGCAIYSQTLQRGDVGIAGMVYAVRAALSVFAVLSAMTYWELHSRCRPR